MRKLQTTLILVLFFAQIAFFAIAEFNYYNAIQRAQATQGTDAEILIVMLEHGFNQTEVFSPVEPDLLEKSEALIKSL